MLLNCSPAESLLKHADDVTTSVLLILVHVVLIILVILSNIAVVAVILHHKRLHTPFNFYIVSLCSSDALVGLFSLPLYTTLEFMCLYNTRVYCVFFKIFRFMTDLTFMMSVYSMVAIGAERHQVVIYPLQHAYTKRQCVTRIVVIFVCSLVYACFWGIWFPAEKHPEYKDIVQLCPDISYISNSNDDAFFLQLAFVDLTILYVIPLTISAALYLRIIHRLWKDTRDWQQRNRQTHETVPIGSVGGSAVARKVSACSSNVSVTWYALSQKKRAIKMCVTILLVFAVMWMPYHIFHIYYVINRSDVQDAPWFLFPIVNIVYFSNSWINCCIYAYYSQKFRSLLKMTLHCSHRAIDEDDVDDEQGAAAHSHSNIIALKHGGWRPRTAHAQVLGRANICFSPAMTTMRSALRAERLRSNTSGSDMFEMANGDLAAADACPSQDDSTVCHQRQLAIVPNGNSLGHGSESAITPNGITSTPERELVAVPDCTTARQDNELAVALNGATELAVAPNGATELAVALNGATELAVALNGATEQLQNELAVAPNFATPSHVVLKDSCSERSYC